MNESDKIYIGGLVFGLGAIVSIPIIAGHIEDAKKPNTFQVTKDYNNDGTKDGVLKKNSGHLVPMYCVTDANGSRYVSAEEYMKLHPDSIIDFTKLEQMVNDGNLENQKQSF